MDLHCFFNKIVGVAMVGLFTSCALAQQELPPSIQATIIVAAEPRHGKDVPALKSEDVMVFQGKHRDKVISLQPLLTSSAGVQLFVLIDDSLSTSDLGSKLSDIRQFITSQPSSVQIGIAYMRNGTALIAQNPTSDHAQIANALRLPMGDLGASASPYFSLEDLLKRWPANNAAREVVMITDGVDPYWDGGGLDDPYINSAIEEAQRHGVVVNAIYARREGHFGHTLWRINWGQNFLSEVADDTGGEAYYLANDSPPSFMPYFTEISKRMQHQYLLTFEPQPAEKNGLQPIKVSTEVPNVDVVAQSRVYLPAG